MRRGIFSLTAFGILILGFVSSAVADPDLVAHWKFDEKSGNTATDSSGNGLDGILVGGPAWVAGRINGALLFDGSDDYVDCGNNILFNITDQITVMCWIKVNSFDFSWQAIVTKGEHTWRLSRRDDLNSLHFCADGSSSQRWLDGETNVNDGNWHHVAGVYDGATLSLYIDGVLDVSMIASGKINTDASDVFVGENGASETSRCFKGIIDDVRIYSRGLSALEVASIAGQTP